MLDAEHSSFEMDGCDGQADHRLLCFQASPQSVVSLAIRSSFVRNSAGHVTIALSLE
jgi:hypothetical protein